MQDNKNSVFLEDQSGLGHFNAVKLEGFKIRVGLGQTHPCSMRF